VGVLDRGGYTRYDFSTADRLLEISKNLMERYHGSLDHLYRGAANSVDLEKRLMELGKGIGPVTVSIFLRDMRRVWPNADPAPTPKVKDAMTALCIGDLNLVARRLRSDRVQLETALHRYYNEVLRAKPRQSVAVAM
jgi:hypothetical protein